METQIFEPSTPPLVGLALLLVYERCLDTSNWDGFLTNVRKLYLRLVYVAVGRHEDNDYNMRFMRIPYGPGWNARQIAHLVYRRVSVIFLYHVQMLNGKNRMRT